jgi:hypothetical protein
VTTKGASDDGRREIPELTKAEKARWDAIRSTIDATAKGLAEGTLDAEGLAATTAKLQQVDVDLKRILDSLHIPADAGEFRDALAAILHRIPDNWGRWISCDAGWYALITRLDAALSALDPDYQIHQIKVAVIGRPHQHRVLRTTLGHGPAHSAGMPSQPKQCRTPQLVSGGSGAFTANPKDYRIVCPAVMRPRARWREPLSKLPACAATTAAGPVIVARYAGRIPHAPRR